MKPKEKVKYGHERYGIICIRCILCRRIEVSAFTAESRAQKTCGAYRVRKADMVSCRKRHKGLAMRKNLKLKGQLRLYAQWPLYLSILLIGMNVCIYMISPDAGCIMALFLFFYLAIAGVLYLRNKPLIYTELVSFATQYGQIQKNLLKELAIPYALLGEDGRLIWTNRQFQNAVGKNADRGRSITAFFPELQKASLPTVEHPHASIDLKYKDSDYQVEMKLIEMGKTLNESNLINGEEIEGHLIDQLAYSGESGTAYGGRTGLY